MPVKLVVTKGRSGKVVVTLQSPGGKKLLASPPLEDRRAASGLLRSLKPVLGDAVAVDDQTKAAAAPAKAAPAKKAPAAKKTAAASTKRSAGSRSTAARTAAPSKKAPATKAPATKAPATKKAATDKKAPVTRRPRAKKAAPEAPAAPAATTNGVVTAPPAEETAPVIETPSDAS
jgi:hypothetical protein